MGIITSCLETFLERLITSLSSLLASSHRRESPGQYSSKFEEMTYHLVVGTYSDSVYTVSFDLSKSGASALSLTSTLQVGFHPSWVQRHPTDPSLVFTCLEQPEGLLLALRYDSQTGIGEIIASIPSGGHSPCSILVTKEEVLVGNVCIQAIEFCDLCASRLTIRLVVHGWLSRLLQASQNRVRRSHADRSSETTHVIRFGTMRRAPRELASTSGVLGHRSHQTECIRTGSRSRPWLGSRPQIVEKQYWRLGRGRKHLVRRPSWWRTTSCHSQR